LLTCWGGDVVEISNLTELDPAPALLVAALPASLTRTQRVEWQACLADSPCPVLLLVNASPLELPDLALTSRSEMLCKPLSRRQLSEALHRHASASQRGEAADNGLHLLVVDDNASNRHLLRELLSRPALAVEEAASGEEALARAKRERFDLVLMDIRMPGMDGVETTRALRRLGGDWLRCPVIAVTAHIGSARSTYHTVPGVQWPNASGSPSTSATMPWLPATKSRIAAVWRSLPASTQPTSSQIRCTASKCTSGS